MRCRSDGAGSRGVMDHDPDAGAVDPDEVLPPGRRCGPPSSTLRSLVSCRPEPRARPRGDHGFRYWSWWRRVLHVLWFALADAEYRLSPDGGLRAILTVVLRLTVVVVAVGLAGLLALTVLVPVATALQAFVFAVLMTAVYVALTILVILVIVTVLGRR